MASVGVDTGKDFVDIACGSKVERVKRTRAQLTESFRQLPQGSFLVIEATGRFHRLVVEVAKECGIQSFLVDPYAFSLYRRSRSPRAKTDRIDAQILQRYGEREADCLRAPKEVPPEIQRLKDLLELRETQVRLRVALEQSLSEMDQLPAACSDAANALRHAEKAVEAQIYQLVKDDPLYAKFREMDGVGADIAPALVWLFRGFEFTDPDQVVSFVGLDVKVRESGKYIGQRKLTKRGPAFMRRLLHCASITWRRIKDLKPFFEKHLKKGLKSKGVSVICSRKILRIAYALATTDARYDRKKIAGT